MLREKRTRLWYGIGGAKLAVRRSIFTRIEWSPRKIWTDCNSEPLLIRPRPAKMSSVLLSPSRSPRRYARYMNAAIYVFRTEKLWFLLLAMSLVTVGCGGYASQAGQYRTQGNSGPWRRPSTSCSDLEKETPAVLLPGFTRNSLRKYVKTIQATAQRFKSLAAPPCR